MAVKPGHPCPLQVLPGGAGPIFILPVDVPWRLLARVPFRVDKSACSGLPVPFARHLRFHAPVEAGLALR